MLSMLASPTPWWLTYNKIVIRLILLTRYYNVCVCVCACMCACEAHLSICSFELSDIYSIQVGIVDLDICGPSVPKLLNVEGQSVITSQYGWVPVRYVE